MNGNNHLSEMVFELADRETEAKSSSSHHIKILPGHLLKRCKKWHSDIMDLSKNIAIYFLMQNKGGIELRKLLGLVKKGLEEFGRANENPKSYLR